MVVINRIMWFQEWTWDHIVEYISDRMPIERWWKITIVIVRIGLVRSRGWWRSSW